MKTVSLPRTIIVPPEIADDWNHSPVERFIRNEMAKDLQHRIDAIIESEMQQLLYGDGNSPAKPVGLLNATNGVA